MVQLISIKRMVLDAVADHFNLPADSLDGDKTFRDLGGGEIDLTSIAINLEYELDVSIDLAVVNQHTTLDRFISKVEAAREEA